MTQNQQTTSNVLSYTEVATPIGELVLIASSKGLCRVAFGSMTQNQEDLQDWISRWFGKGTELQRMQPTLRQSCSSWGVF